MDFPLSHALSLCYCLPLSHRLLHDFRKMLCVLCLSSHRFHILANIERLRPFEAGCLCRAPPPAIFPGPGSTFPYSGFLPVSPPIPRNIFVPFPRLVQSLLFFQLGHRRAFNVLSLLCSLFPRFFPPYQVYTFSLSPAIFFFPAGTLQGFFPLPRPTLPRRLLMQQTRAAIPVAVTDFMLSNCNPSLAPPLLTPIFSLCVHLPLLRLIFQARLRNFKIASPFPPSFSFFVNSYFFFPFRFFFFFFP